MSVTKKDPVGTLIGKVGAGKTTIFNKVCDANRLAEITDDSCTRQFVSKNIFYDGLAMELYDGPGCNSKEDTYAHSFVLRHGLTHEPLSGVFVTLTYEPRIRNNMGGDFYEVAKILKPQYYDLIVLVVTKMDQFRPDVNFPTCASMEQHIREVFRKDYGVKRVVFSCKDSTAAELFHAMRAAVADMPKVQLVYTDEEFMEYFDMKAWKGREQFDLHRLKKQVEKLCAEFEEGLAHLVQGRSNFSNDEVQDYIYAMVQQNRVELDENVYTPFLRRNGDDEVAFDDYAASIELQKLIHRAHEDFRNEAKRHLAVNPDNHADLRNAIRRCQYCREVWVKVEGCDGETVCGARPVSLDAQSTESYFRLQWERIEGKLRPGKFLMKRKKQRKGGLSHGGHERQIGCGECIVWKDQAVVPVAELDCLFSTQELENILSSFKMGSEFQKLKGRKERKIKVFGKLDENGQDLTTAGNENDEGDTDDDRLASSSEKVEVASAGRALLA